jgi:hypothetical protein
MNIFFSVLSAAYIAGIFLLADSPMVFDMATFNPYSLLHIPLYGILTILLTLSFSKSSTNPKDSSSSSSPRNPVNSVTSTNSTNPTNPRNLRNPIIAGIIALVVAIADEIHQAYLPNRNASFTDVLLDVVGIIFFILVLRRIQNIPWFLKRIKSLRRITQ